MFCFMTAKKLWDHYSIMFDLEFLDQPHDNQLVVIVQFYTPSIQMEASTIHHHPCTPPPLDLGF